MERPQVVAEIGQGKGHVQYIADAIEAARKAGCWAAKIQLLQPESIAQPHADVYWDEHRPGITDQRASFDTVGCLDYGEVAKLCSVAEEIGIELIATPFDLEAVEVMAKADMKWCKIASGDITNRPLLEAVGEAFPHATILSTGAAELQEIDDAFRWLGEPWAVLACTLSYPTLPEDAELARIPKLRRWLDERDASHVFVGYSDHTHAPSTAGYAVAAGATVLEKHFTLDRTDETVPDNAFAVDPEAMAAYVAAADEAAVLMGDGAFLPLAAEQPARTGARRAICAARDLPAGHCISAEDLVMLRPALKDGFEPTQAPLVTGCVTRREIREGTAITPSLIKCASAVP